MQICFADHAGNSLVSVTNVNSDNFNAVQFTACPIPILLAAFLHHAAVLALQALY